MAKTKITVRALHSRAVNVPLAKPLPTSSGVISTVPLVLIDLQTEEGITGCAYVFCYTPLAMKPIAQLVANLEAILKGDSAAPYAIEQKLQQSFRLLGPQGLTGIAMSGVDMAAWDALAKACGMPLVKMLGGEAKPIPAYASYFMDGVEGGISDAEEAAGTGFKAMKIKTGYPSVHEDIEVIRAIRRAVGEEMAIMVDYNQSLSVPEAIKRTRLLDDEGVYWIEEPTIADDFEGHARITRETKTPVQIGENWWGTHDMTKSIAAGASDLAMPDVMKIGGVSGWMRASALAENFSIPVSSHIFQEISAHLLAVTPTCHWLEQMDLAGPILKEPLRFEDGYALISKTPGNGMSWDEEAVSRYLEE